MKNVFLGLALATLSLACVSEQKASVDDAAGPAPICTPDCAKACCMADAKCSGEKSAEKKVCPATGQEIN